MVTAVEYRARVAAAMSEADLQAQVVALARALGWLTYHTRLSKGSEPGFPDLVLLHPDQGRVLYRELKSARGRLTPAQTEWITALTQAGADAAVWHPTDLLDGTVEHTLRRTP